MTSPITESRWKDLLALTMVLFAVFSTIAWYKDSGHSTTALLSQAQASNAWSHYQSKSLKSYLYIISKEKLELEIKSIRATQPAMVHEYEILIQTYDERVKSYEKDRQQIEQTAKDQEKIRDQSQLYSDAFGRSMMLLQIAIVFCSLASLLDKKSFWYASLVVGLVGFVFFANGWYLFL